MKSREFDRFTRKLGFELIKSRRKLHHIQALFRYDGKLVARTRRSHGNRDQNIEIPVAAQIHITPQQVREAIDCSFGREEYLAELRRKNIIPPESTEK